MKIQAVIFDLDDTLLVDEAVSKAALVEVAALAQKKCGIAPRLFLDAVALHGFTLWKSGSCYAYCRAIGISYHECLWGIFAGESAELTALRTWATDYRIAVFDAVLRSLGFAELDTAVELASKFALTRRQLQRLMPDAKETLLRLKADYRIGLLTNGAPDLQREKIAASGLASSFAAIAVSGEHGIGKPQPRIFEILLAELGVSADRAVMVGNSLERDIAGAKNAQLAAAIWIQVAGSEEQADVVPDYTITGLHELPSLLAAISN